MNQMSSGHRSVVVVDWNLLEAEMKLNNNNTGNSYRRDVPYKKALVLWKERLLDEIPALDEAGAIRWKALYE
jgi:hypothetical protein